MSKRNYRILILDILQNIEKINKYIAYLNFEDLQKDDKTKDAVIKNLMEIGEAANHIPDEICNNFSDIPWTQMISLRNRLIHGYFVIDYDIVWTIIKDELPLLYGKLKAIIDE